MVSFFQALASIVENAASAMSRDAQNTKNLEIREVHPIVGAKSPGQSKPTALKATLGSTFPHQGQHRRDTVIYGGSQTDCENRSRHCAQ